MTAEIRPLRADDVAAAHELSFTTFAELDARLGDPVPEHTDRVRARGEARIAHLLRTDPEGVWVAEQDDQLVGVALAMRRGPLWYLSLLTVDPAQQGGGIGRLLLEAALTTADDAGPGLIMSSSDPKALRRYARAGFELRPGYDGLGAVDRTALPAGLDVRDGDLAGDAGLVEDVVTRLRGGPYGPDLAVWAGIDTLRLLRVEKGADRGFCVTGPERVVSLGATSPELAQRLLWAALADVSGEQHLMALTAGQQWAVDVLLEARLSVKPGTSLCTRGPIGPLSPYLPNGAYG